MTHMIRLLSVLVCSFCLVLPAMAQMAQQGSGTAVTQTGTRGDVASRCDSTSGSAQQTLTLQNPGPGLSNYITVIGAFGLATGGVTNAASTAITTTGINGTTANLGFPIASATTAALTTGATSGGYVNIATAIKSNANVAGTFVGPAAITNMNQLLEVCYYPAP